MSGRRRDGTDRVKKEKRAPRERSRSHSRRRSRRHEASGGGGVAPPQDWRGPADGRGPPPAEWRGPGGYSGPPPGAPGAYPPPRGSSDPTWYGDHVPPQRPPGPFMPPMRAQVPGGPMLGAPDYGWMHPHPDDAGQYRGTPPGEWRGPSMQRPPFGLPVARPLTAPQGAPFPGADPWGGRPPGSEGPASFPGPFQHGKGRDAERPPEPPPQLALTDGGSDQASAPAVAMPLDATSQGAPGPNSGVGADDGDDDDAVPPPRTAADRFRNVRIVRSAISESMTAYLRKKGVPLDSRFCQRASTSVATEEAGLAEDAAASRECARLGLDGGAQRARLPMPGPLRLPVCTVELQHVGLWERFRQRCGTPVPREPPPIQCELKKSRGGGQVVLPHVLPAGPGPAAPPSG